MMNFQSKGKLFSDRDLLCLIFPLVIELALKLIVGLIDSVMVSSVGEAAVSGVSLIDSVMQLLIYIFAALASGGAVVAGQYLGAKEEKSAVQAAGELLWVNMLLSAGIMLMILLASNWILTHLFGHIEPEVYYHAQRYFYVAAFSIPAIGIFEAGTAIFRTMNHSKITMKISMIMNGINGIGNAVLIYGCAMGTRGAAVATLASRWTAAVMVVILLLDPGRELYIERSWRHHFDFQMTGRILAVGIPGGVENGIFQLGKIAILGLVAAFGTSAITANAVTQTLASLEMIPGSAIQLAVVTVISRCIGAEDFEQAKFYNRKLLRISYVTIFGWSLSMVLLLPAILRIYHLSAGTADMAVSMFLWHSLGAILFWPLAFDLPASLRAAADVRFPMIVSVASMWIFRFGGARLLCKRSGFGAVGVWIAMSILDWGFRAGCFSARWHSGKWKRMGINSRRKPNTVG